MMMNSLSEAVRQNREIKGQVRRQARDIIMRLGPGQRASVTLPDREPLRRDCYIAVNAVAHEVLGTGRYQLSVRGQSVEVTASRGRSIL